MNFFQRILASNQTKRFKRKFFSFSGLHIQVKRYTPSACEELRSFALLNHKKIDTVIDIGANEGQFAEGLLMAGFKGKIISFEPVSKVRETLLKNSRRYPNWIIAERCAIGDVDTTIDIRISDDTVFSSVLEIKNEFTKDISRAQSVASESVPCYKLDTIIWNYLDGKDKRILLKVDTQGFEKQVFEGATKLLQDVIGIKTEIPLFPIYEGTEFTFYEMVRFLESNNFEPYSFHNEGVNLKTGRLNTLDGIFFRKELNTE